MESPRRSTRAAAPSSSALAFRNQKNGRMPRKGRGFRGQRHSKTIARPIYGQNQRSTHKQSMHFVRVPFTDPSRSPDKRARSTCFGRNDWRLLVIGQLATAGDADYENTHTRARTHLKLAMIRHPPGHAVARHRVLGSTHPAPQHRHRHRRGGGTSGGHV